MIKKSDIEKIIKAGSLAPSGSNSQPWKFLVKDGAVFVHALYEKDHPILNYRNRGTLLAHGALLENMSIAAAALGYKANSRLFPHGGNNPVSETTFIEAEPSQHDLYEAVSKRAINRKPYKKMVLEETMREEIIKESGDVEIKLIEDKKAIADLAKAASISELLMFENEALHTLLMEEIVWTEADERAQKSGLFLKTMELNPPQRMVLKRMKAWKAVKLANILGFSKMIATGNAKIYKASSAMGILLVADRDESFIEAGRIMERLWLRATARGLEFHIMTGVGFFWQRIFLGTDETFSKKHKDMVGSAYDSIKRICGSFDDKIPAVIFRIGYGDGPSARSSKKDPEIVFEE